MNSNLTKGNGGFAHVPPVTHLSQQNVAARQGQQPFDVWLDKQDVLSGIMNMQKITEEKYFLNDYFF